VAAAVLEIKHAVVGAESIGCEDDTVLEGQSHDARTSDDRLSCTLLRICLLVVADDHIFI
jgi:hypothetical protein